jgi:release factor glutamine methyltransferase
MPTSRTLTPYEQNELRKWKSLVKPSLIGEKPIEYVTGHAQFLGFDFLVTPDTLIPRLESEQIVTLALQYIDDHQLAHPVIADIGTGSGCLGISLAIKLSKRQIPYSVFLSDISPQALKVADLNAQRLLHSPENLFFQESNLLENYPSIKFDLILANLPYIPTPNIKSLSPSVKDYEPITALDGGVKGNLFINALLDKLPKFLSPKGLAILEINDTHTIDSFTLPKDISAHIENDCFQKPRFLLCTYL